MICKGHRTHSLNWPLQGAKHQAFCKPCAGCVIRRLGPRSAKRLPGVSGQVCDVFLSVQAHVSGARCALGPRAKIELKRLIRHAVRTPKLPWNMPFGLDDRFARQPDVSPVSHSHTHRHPPCPGHRRFRLVSGNCAPTGPAQHLNASAEFRLTGWDKKSLQDKKDTLEPKATFASFCEPQ